jgi:hypothetical protein
MKCVWLLLVLSALASTRCSTTTHGSLGTPATNAWIGDHDSYRAGVTLVNGSAERRIAGVLSREAPAFQEMQTQPARIRLLSISDGRAIPLEEVREVKVVKRARGALDGALIGLGVGALSGLVLGLAAGDSPNREDCGYPCTGAEKGELTAAVYGGIGTVLGAIVGAAIGHRDVLTF